MTQRTSLCILRTVTGKITAIALSLAGLAAVLFGTARLLADEGVNAPASQPAGLTETRTGQFDAYWQEPPIKDFAREIEQIYMRYGDSMPKDIQNYLISGIRAQSAANDTDSGHANTHSQVGSWADAPPTPPKTSPGDQVRADVKTDDKLTYHIYVPDDYKPGRPYGVLVWMFPTDGESYRQQWTKTLDQYHVIWIAPDMAGSHHNRYWRAFLALYAVDQAQHRFTVDPQRIYIGGDSSGGYQASEVALLYPQMFNGGVFEGEVAFYKSVASSEGQGWEWPGFLRDYKLAGVDLSRHNERVVVIGDSHNRWVNDRYQGYVKDGFANVTLIDPSADNSNGSSSGSSGGSANDTSRGGGTAKPTPSHVTDPIGGTSHTFSRSNVNETEEITQKAILALDAPLITAADNVYKTAQLNEKSRRLGDACVNYGLAAAHAGNKPWAADAQQKADSLQKDFDAQIAQIEDLLSQRQFDKATAAARSMLDVWGKMGHDRLIDLLHEIADVRAGKSVHH